MSNRIHLTARTILTVLSIAGVSGCLQAQEAQIATQEPIVGGPCEGCEAVFEGIPAELNPIVRLTPPDEPGESLIVEGTVRNHDGSTAAGTIVYAYQTNAEGVYPRNEAFRGQAAYRHGTLRGWIKVGDDGRYRFDTVRPGSYPNSSIPQHIHLHVIEPGRCTYYIDDIVFTDDPLLSPDVTEDYSHGRGGIGITTPTRDPDGVWRVDRDIVLGEGIHDYPMQ